MRTGSKCGLAAIVCLLSGGALVALNATARADTFGTACCGRADDAVHWACWVPNPGTSTISQPLWDHLFGYVDGHAIMQTTVPWSATCAAGTDMFLDNRLSNPNLYGFQNCRVPLVSGVCAEANVQINDGLIVSDAAGAGLSANAFRRYNWCHEGGHSFGLNHTTGTNCLITGLQTELFYSTHHATHVRDDL